MAALFLLGSPAVATVHNGTIMGDEAQATTCAVGSTTQAVGTFSYDDVTNLFSWSYTYGDNAPNFDNGALFGGGTETIAHFHGPAAPGVPAGVTVGTGTGTPNTGSATITPTQGADLLADLWYLNVHSTTCTGGEIRGQAIVTAPVPSSSNASGLMVVASLMLVGLGLLRRRSAQS